MVSQALLASWVCPWLVPNNIKVNYSNCSPFHITCVRALRTALLLRVGKDNGSLLRKM